MTEKYPCAPDQALFEQKQGAIVATYTMKRLPDVEAPAPEEVRQQWIGLPLPVREKLLASYRSEATDEAKSKLVPVCGKDVIAALRKEHRDEAAWHWSTLGYGEAVFPFPLENGILESVKPDQRLKN